MTYQLCNDNLRWATVFREMEHHRERLGVTDYSVSQTTLEQVCHDHQYARLGVNL